ncbi:hypothetical protein ACFVUS_37660 [Nocardia sp. NPDC058058]|uniref:hypothetical protein n=1 Tax=Nocardia sp. NPDC058058 TaxID=3346317 RepID=UPI0036DF9DB6
MGWNRLGRYRGTGEEAMPGTSIMETNLFAILNFVLGNGKRNYRVGGYHGLRTDMGFEVGTFRRHILVVEYDGAYWHHDREQTDVEKICRTLDYGDHDIVRIREQPLRRLRAADVSVPKRSDALTCARLALLHVAHRPAPLELDTETLVRVQQFLSIGNVPLNDTQIICGFCQELNYVLYQEHPFPPVNDSPRRRVFHDCTFTRLTAEISWAHRNHESRWHPDDRSWEQAEADSAARRGFTNWLDQQRTQQQANERPDEPANDRPDDSSTIRLF